MGQKILEILNKTATSFNVGKLQIDATYWMVGVLLLLLFMVLFSIARVRYLYVHWNLGKSSIAFLFWGFILAVGVEGIFMLYGRTIFTDILGVENTPKPFSTVLDIGITPMSPSLAGSAKMRLTKPASTAIA